MDFDFGPMRRAELRARTAPPEQTVEEESKAGAGGKRPADRRDALIDMLAPLFCLICVTFLAMLYSGAGRTYLCICAVSSGETFDSG